MVWLRYRHVLRYAVGLLALGWLGLELLRQQPEQPSPLLALTAALLLALLANLTVRFSRADGALVHPVAVALGLAMGAGPAGVLLLMGLLPGELARSFWPRSPSHRRASQADRLSLAAFAWGHQALSLFAALAAFRALGASSVSTPNAGRLPLMGFLLTFLLVHVLLFLADLLLRGEAPRQFLRHNLVTYGAYELLPLPFGVLAAMVLLALGSTTFLIIGGVSLTIAFVLDRLGEARSNLEQRLRELSTVNRVSRAMRTSLDLDALLDTIYLQVAHVLGVRNMYVALYELETDMVSYPLVVLGGKRQTWPTRRRARRLTDWVISTRSPLLVPYDVRATLRRMNLEEGENQPHAWLGVPLLAADRALGCLAVFTTQPGETFGQEDLALLSTLGAQASVAVENAQLYGETRRRAAELATLNEIVALMSASLDPERVLELVSSSVIRVVGAQKSAIFLRDPDRNELWLARAEGMSHEFMRANLTLPLEDGPRVRAVTSGSPQIVGDVERQVGAGDDLRRLAEAEGFRAFAELPLLAQGSIIGFLAIYFAEPHHFAPAEVDLLRTFASQAALAVANARLYARTDQALARRVEQLSVLEAIARELTATLDLGRLFEMILDRAMGFTAAEAGSLVLYQPATDTVRIVASRGYSPEALSLRVASRLAGAGITGRAMREGIPVYSRDVTEDRDYIRLAIEPMRSQLSVPIVREGKSLGVITLESSTSAAFSTDDEQFIAQLAAQAAIAIDNAHLYEEVQRRLREQSVLYDAAANIASTLQAQTVLDTVAQSLAQLLHADGVSISDWDRVSDSVVSVTALDHGVMDVHPQDAYRLEHYPETRRVLVERVPLILQRDDPQAEAGERALLAQLGYAAVAILPMIAADQVVGLVEIYDDNPRTFSQNEIQLAQTLANQAAIAIENARLFQRVIEGRDRLAAVLDSTREGVLMIDASGRIALANPRVEGFFGVSRDGLEGQLLADLLADPEAPIAAWLGYTHDELRQLVAQLSQGASPVTQVVDYQIEAPRPRFLQRSGTPVRDEAGRVIGWVLVLRDITEEKELQEAREDLTSMIVHDLRSPLTAVLGALSLISDLLEGEMRSGVARQAMDVSIRSCKKLLNLVDSMLDIARLEGGNVLLERHPVRLHAVVEGVVADLQPLASEQGIDLINNVSPDLPEVRIDDEKVTRVFTNLIDNALKFSPAGGQVRVDARADGGSNVIECAVLDDGPGIPEDYRERVFDRFVQVQGRRGRRRGTGLGLAFVKLAVEAHRGAVWVENRPEGGSRFAFTLPASGSPDDLALETQYPPAEKARRPGS